MNDTQLEAVLPAAQRLRDEVLAPLKSAFVAKEEVIDLLGVCLAAGENLFMLGIDMGIELVGETDDGVGATCPAHSAVTVKRGTTHPRPVVQDLDPVTAKAFLNAPAVQEFRFDCAGVQCRGGNRRRDRIAVHIYVLPVV